MRIIHPNARHQRRCYCVTVSRLFGHATNILLIGLVAYLGAIGLNYIGNAFEHAGELLNFGAFLAFMGVNFSAFWHFIG